MRSHYPTVIVGTGPTGMSAAYHLDEEHLMLERETKVGGLNKSIDINGFVYDYAGHILFTNDEYARSLFNKLLGDNVHYQVREAWCYQKGVHTMYPFQANTYGLPREVVRECVAGAAEAFLKYGHVDPKTFANFREWNEKTYGEGICSYFQEPYNRKLWKVPLESMSHDWLSGRVPKPKIEEIIEGAIRPGLKNMGPNAYFGYPLRGGFQALVDGWRKFIDFESIQTESVVTKVSIRHRTVTVNGKQEIGFGKLITTMPLPELVRCLEDAPTSIREAGESLRATSILCVNVGIDRDGITDKHWIYYPEPDLFFHRIFVQGNASPFNKPEGTSSYIAEISYLPGNAPPRDVAIERTIESLEKVGLKAPDDRVLVAEPVYMPYAYVVPQPGVNDRVALIKDYLGEHDIYTVGRFGEWAYYNSDHSMLAGKRAADMIKARKMKGTTVSLPAKSSAEKSSAEKSSAATTLRAGGEGGTGPVKT